MWKTTIINTWSKTIFANEIALLPGARSTLQHVPTGVAIYVPELGAIHLHKASANGHNFAHSAVKVSSGQHIVYWEYQDHGEIVLAIHAEGTFTIHGVPGIHRIQSTSPDGVYPIPSLHGEVNSDHINLLTGDINLRINLFTFADGAIKHPIDLFYNSRSVAINASSDDNIVHGSGWKLLDYPKIVEKDENTFLFLDGLATYELVANTQSSSTYSLGGAYRCWQAQRQADATWSVIDDKGIQYILSNKAILSTGYVIWNLGQINDLSWPQSQMLFRYTGTMPVSITNSLGDEIKFNWNHSTHILESVDWARQTDKVLFLVQRIELQYTQTSPYQLASIQAIMILPHEIYTPQMPVDAGYQFTYLPTDDPTNPKALASMQTPLGAISKYTYYNGNKILSGGVPVTNLHPVICVLNQLAQEVTICSGLFYSFQNWAWDTTQTYAQYNMTKEYEGGVYDNSDIDNPEDPYGHTTSLFFNGQPATQLIQYSGNPDIVQYPSLLGQNYTNADYSIVRTQTNQIAGSGESIPAWPGLSFPVSVASNTIISVAFQTHSTDPTATNVYLQVENTALQVGFAGASCLNGQPGQGSADFTVFAPVTNLRVYADRANVAKLDSLTLTSVVAPEEPAVPPITNIPTTLHALISTGMSPVPDGNGSMITLTAAYPNTTAVVATFWSLSSSPAKLGIFCYDSAGNTVASGNFQAPSSAPFTVTLSFPAATVKQILLVGSSGGTALGLLSLNYQATGISITDDSLSEQIAFTENTYGVGRPGDAAWARLDQQITSLDGIEKTVAISYVNENTLPLPMNIYETLLKPDQTNDSSAPDTIQTRKQITYAVQKYSALAAKNILSSIAQVIEYTTPAGATESAISGTTVQWQDWNSGSWGPWKQYRQQQAQAGDGFAPNPDSGWLLQGQVIQRNSRGRALSTTHVDGTVSSQVFDAVYGTWNIIHFANADAYSNQAGYYGCQAYESTAGWVFSGGSFQERGSFTGNRYYTGQNLNMYPDQFKPRGNVAYVAAAYVRLDAGSGAQIGFQQNGSYIESPTKISYDSNQPGWRYIQAVLNAPTGQFVPTVWVGSGAIDHLVFAPLDCDFQATVWEASWRVPVATIETNGAVTHHFYDACYNPLATATPGRQLSLVNRRYTSALGQYWFTNQAEYNDSAPNMEFDMRSPGNNLWDAFTSAPSTVFPPSQLKNMALNGNHLLSATASVSPQNPGWATMAGSAGSADFLVIAEIVPGRVAATDKQYIGLSVYQPASTGGGRDLLFGLLNGSFVLRDLAAGQNLAQCSLANQPGAFLLTLVVRNGTNLLGYVDGRFIFQVTLSGSAVTGSVTLRTTWPESYFYNFGLLPDPELANTTADGAGYQEQFLETTGSNSRSIMEYLYGGKRQLYAGQALPTTQSGMNLSPQLDFATLDADTMTISGSINQSWPDRANTPFADSLQRYLDPSVRVSTQGKGGIYTAGQPGSVNYAYGENTGSYFPFPKDQLHADTLVEASGMETITYSNRENMVFGKARINPQSTQALLTGFEYDNALRLAACYYPNAYSSPTTVDRSIFYQQTGYDFVGNVRSAKEPDLGTVQYLYDQADRLRIRQDANGAAGNPPLSIYMKYDTKSRLLEDGLYTGDITAITTAQLNDPTWPQQNTTWRRKFTWDRPNSNELNCLGRITSVQTPDTTSRYYYDLRGNTTRIEIQIATDTTETFDYTYDGMDRVVEIQGPSGYLVTYTYDEANRVIAIGNLTAPAFYASYEYGNGLISEHLNNGSITRTYTLNALGAYETIDDPYFREELYYETRYNGQPGYLDGSVASTNNVFKWQNAPGSYSWEYTYDAFGRLQGAQHSADASLTLSGMAYDANSNIQALTQGGTPQTFQYNSESNRLANTGQGQGFVYDGNGNITASQRIQLTNLTYDTFTNLPAQATLASQGQPLSFLYDASGFRVQRSSGSGTTIYLRNPAGKTLLTKTTGSAGTQITGYIYGPTGRIAMQTLGSGGSVYYLLRDHLESTRVVVQQTGQVVSWFNYMPFGALIASQSNEGSISCRYRYTGKEWDADLQLYEFQARFYDPAIGRYYAPDPLHQFASPYAYAEDPISYIDPTGEFFVWAAAIVGGAILGGSLELLRQAVNGEDISWKKAAGGAIFGAALAAGGLFVAGGSATVAATEAYSAVKSGIGLSTLAGAVMGGVKNRDKGAGGIVTGILRGGVTGAITGSQTAIASSFMTSSIVAIHLGRSIYGSAGPVVAAGATLPAIGVLAGAATGGTNALVLNLIQGSGWQDTLLSVGTGVVIGAVGGKYKVATETNQNLAVELAPIGGGGNNPYSLFDDFDA